jgi:hypothetical protein
MRWGVPDAALPACKGQKTTKDYASLGAKKLSTKGGTLCVPRFKDWGGTMTYPGPTTGVTASLVSSTTPYSGPLWPPFPPATPIFYIQFNTTYDDVQFGKKLPRGGDLAGKQLNAKQAYTVTASVLSGGRLWDGFGECYATAVNGKYGPDLPDVGGVFSGTLKVTGTHVVIEIIPGEYGTTKC